MPKPDIDIKQLLEAGAHFGHKTSRWHPKMASYLHSKRGGSHIIDLTKTVEQLEAALDFLCQTVAAGKQVVLVSTKPQAQALLKEAAEAVGMPYVSERWLGGMLTNQNTIGRRIKYLKDLEDKMASGELAAKYSKLEVQRYAEEIEEMNHLYGGIKDMQSKPGALFVVDVITDQNAVLEAVRLGIPVVAMVDSNADPTKIRYPIPCNDDAIKAIELVLSYVKQAILDGQAKAKTTAEAGTDKPAATTLKGLPAETAADKPPVKKPLFKPAAKAGKAAS